MIGMVQLLIELIPKIKSNLVENRLISFPTMMFPGTNPGIKVRSIPICDGDRPYTFAATNGAPTKKIFQILRN